MEKKGLRCIYQLPDVAYIFQKNVLTEELESADEKKY